MVQVGGESINCLWSSPCTCAICIFLLWGWRQALKTFHFLQEGQHPLHWSFNEPDWCDDKDAQIFISTIITLVSTLKFVGVKVFLRENLHSSWDNLNTHKVLISVMIVEMRNCASLLSHQSGSSEESSFFCKICGYAVLPMECEMSLEPASTIHHHMRKVAYCTSANTVTSLVLGHISANTGLIFMILGSF